ncbi:hypothetical protein [Niabella beijingensis]|uniref:hypothetical protein n=1 Tax=Niabella beijingensis TaxID=2872700 RepID=UPI001CC115C4|nr:hypothetical protein [Niabella beijingensis]MBZ4188976.1 hypothetical protein [Niabella beijingensis]
MALANEAKMKMELKNIRIVKELSEETIAFSATLYVNNKKIAVAMNRGNGSCTTYTLLKKEDAELLREAENHCKTLPPYKLKNYPSMGIDTDFPMDLETFIEEQIDQQWRKTELKKFNRKLLKDQKDSIVFGIKNKSYRRLQLTKSIEELLHIKNGIKLIEFKILHGISKYLKEGESILNTNLPKEVVELIRRPKVPSQGNSDIENRPRFRKAK